MLRWAIGGMCALCIVFPEGMEGNKRPLPRSSQLCRCSTTRDRRKSRCQRQGTLAASPGVSEASQRTQQRPRCQ